MSIWITSDSHFGHANIIRYSNRPFASVDEMDEELIARWNAVVSPNDKVYHLGDVYFGRYQGWLERLNGKKRLILGNHDNGNDQNLHRNFKKIQAWRIFKDFDLVLSHMPLHQSSLFKVSRNVHGHTHNHFVMQTEDPTLRDERYVNVCVEHTNYTPINIEQFRPIF